jgi:hypothetical protein
MKAKLILVVSIVLACAPGNARATCAVTRAGYTALQMLMTYSDVVKTLGCEGEHIFDRKDDPRMVSSEYMWDGAAPRSRVDLVFGNGKLMGMSQYNLD